jgi:hypothetical protein
MKQVKTKCVWSVNKKLGAKLKQVKTKCFWREIETSKNEMIWRSDSDNFFGAKMKRVKNNFLARM